MKKEFLVLFVSMIASGVFTIDALADHETHTCSIEWSQRDHKYQMLFGVVPQDGQRGMLFASDSSLDGILRILRREQARGSCAHILQHVCRVNSSGNSHQVMFAGRVHRDFPNAEAAREHYNKLVSSGVCRGSGVIAPVPVIPAAPATGATNTPGT